MTTMEFAKFLAELRFEKLPSEVVEQAKTVLQDFCGVALFASKTPWGKVIADFAATEGYGRGEATIIGHSQKSSPSRAALANGTNGLGFEFDHTHPGSLTHTSTAVIPAALAMAEMERAGGKELLTSIVAGYEATTRTSMATMKWVGNEQHLGGRGLYRLPYFGPFGAAAAAGNILKFDSEKMAMALGLAGERSCGTRQSHVEGAWSRRWWGGTAAESGITAALLTKAGFIGPTKILEGKEGLYHTHAMDFYPEKLTEGLGQSYEIMNVMIKFYPIALPAQADVGLVLELKKEYNINPGDVRKIICNPGEENKLNSRKDVPTMAAAQYSIPFSVATAMLKGKLTISEFTEEAIRDPEILAYLNEKVEVVFDKELVERGRGNNTAPGRVIIQLKDGTEYSREVIFPKGHPNNPLTQEELRAKFNSLATAVLSKTKANKLYTLIRTLDTVGDASQMIELLRLIPSRKTQVKMP